jgi:hypothetical protein
MMGKGMGKGGMGRAKGYGKGGTKPGTGGPMPPATPNGRAGFRPTLPEQASPRAVAAVAKSGRGYKNGGYVKPKGKK